MSADVLLVFPGLFFELGYPLGLAYLAAALKHAGHQVHGCDVAVESPRGLDQRLAQGRYDVVGLAVWHANMHKARRAAARIRERSDALVVVGGPHATIDPYGTLAMVGADLAVLGEGERTFTAVVDAVEAGGDPRGLPGTAWIEHASLRRGPPAPAPADPADLPRADRAVFPVHHYSKPWAHRGRRRAPIITSRGCPCRCRHCSAPALHDGSWRGRPPEDVADEMRWLQREHGVEHVMIEDEHPFMDRDRFVEICQRLARDDTGQTWGLPNGVRPETLDSELVAAMAKAGCRQLSLGLESADAWMLARLGRHASLDAAREATFQARSHGIDVTAYFMMGLPGERPGAGRRALGLATEIGATSAHFSLFIPVKGSVLERHQPVRGARWRLRRTGLYMGFYAHPSRALQVLRHAQATPADWASAVRQLLSWLDYGGKGVR